ncbi:unnamed protein product [Hymenolepis diminuta]|uniref:BHLH domain-containing protein n=1 Tax=Hymenolepis diminuta TaxID=6216 RepID=A0A0R3SHA7_HYMDI|nr:unnamed protein product [Hymenolepis diminuta]
MTLISFEDEGRGNLEISGKLTHPQKTPSGNERRKVFEARTRQLLENLQQRNYLFALLCSFYRRTTITSPPLSSCGSLPTPTAYPIACLPARY